MVLGGVTVKTPQVINESYVYIRKDNETLNGTAQRNQLAKKKVSTLRWTNIAPVDFLVIFNLVDPGSSLTYANPQSKYGTFNFTARPTISTNGDNVRGGSYLTEAFEVVFREV